MEMLVERDLTSLSCGSLVAREFWIDDRRVSTACYVFLLLSNGKCIGWWFNDDPELWEIEELGNFPIPAECEAFFVDGRKWHYPHIDLTTRFAVRDRLLTRWVAESLGPISVARLEFADGSCLIFGRDCRQDGDWIELQER
jgi:hypothetical protein